MPTESIWTALPTGRGRASLTLSVHVIPRLTVAGGGDDSLASFPAFASWPPRDLTFEVVVGGTTYPTSAVTVVSTPDPALWTALFPHSSRVRSYVPTDRSQTPIHTYPLTKIAAFLKDRYTDVAINSGEFHPSIDDLLAGGFEDIRFSGRDGRDKWDANRAQLVGVLADNKVIDTRAASTTTFDFVQLEDFFAALDGSDPTVAAAYEAPVEPPRLDFHDAVQFVNQHPALMRLVGLVFDLEVRTSSAPSAQGPATVRVVPISAALAGTAVHTPRTRATISASGFSAVPRPGSAHVQPGWLRLEDPTQYEVLHVDADGGGLKAVDVAGNLKRVQLHPTEDSPEEAALPTLRADGFSVARLGKAQELHDTLVEGVAEQGQLAAGTLTLYLDDLTRGVRVDVWDSRSGSWHSVMQRTGQYELDGGSTVIPVTDEGVLGSTASKKPLSDHLYLSEEVFWWDGWSLVVPRPGRALSIDPAAPDPPVVERPPNDPGPDFDARFHFDVPPGTLPRLRYGVDYRFRARLVDLAGNSLPPDVADDSHATPATTFGRFEPPQTPPVLLRTPNGPGESLETVVLRSNFDDDPTPPTAERHIVPAKVGQLTVEVHGLVDAPDPDPSEYAMLATLDAATLLNHPSIDGGDGDRNRYYDLPLVETTWAPDPAARKFAFRLLDGPHGGDIGIHPLGDLADWPKFVGARIVLVEETGTPTYDPSTRVLTVPMAKADIVHARLSALIEPAELDQFALWNWVRDVVPPGPAGQQILDEQIDLISSGQHWMFEPYRRLTLVHAVRQPLARPEFPNPLNASRQSAQTFTLVLGQLDFSRKSTSRVDVLASWREPVDRGPHTGQPDVVQPWSVAVDRQTAFTLDIDHAPDLHPTQIRLENRHELGDTKHRMITYRAVATTRFGEYFTSSDEFPFSGPGSIVVLDTGTPASGLVAGSVKLSFTGDGAVVRLVEGTHFDVDVETGTLSFGDAQTGGLPPVGSIIRAVYLVPPITRETSDPPTQPGESGPRLLSVPSSARPQAPKVRYVIPTFGWEDDDVVSGGEVVGLASTRRGNGIRVYLERPWWTSGEGELLGVVLWPPAELSNPPELDTGSNDEVDRRRPFVTQWGQDPIYGSRLLPFRYPRLESFPTAVGPSTNTGLTLAELGSSTAVPVNVAGHAVGFDTSRDLWYCDIAVDPGPAYSPLIRLALARWQPASIPNAQLSRVVLADFVQLAPDRFASVVFDAEDDSVVGVTLTGPTHASTNASKGSNPGTARVIVEQRGTGLTGELAWQQVGPMTTLSATLLSGVGQWIGEVQLPGPRVPGTWRLVIEQFELMGAEPSTKPPLANPNLAAPPVPTARLVHTDIIAL